MTHEQLWLANLRGEISEESDLYMTRQEACQALKADTGQDFGLDTEAWDQWLNENRSTEMNWDKSDRPWWKFW